MNAAGADADAGAGASNIGDPVEPWPAELRRRPPNLKVTVQDAKTGAKLGTSSVTITGTASFPAESTDSNGLLQKNAVSPGPYTATATNTGYTTETGSATVTPNKTAAILIKLKAITVKLRLGQPVGPVPATLWILRRPAIPRAALSPGPLRRLPPIWWMAPGLQFGRAPPSTFAVIVPMTQPGIFQHRLQR